MPDHNIKEHPPDTQPLMANPRPLACRIFLHSDAQISSRDARMGPSRSQMDLRRSSSRPRRLRWSRSMRKELSRTSLGSSTASGGRSPTISLSNSQDQAYRQLRRQSSVSLSPPTKIPLEKRIRSPNLLEADNTEVQTERPTKVRRVISGREISCVHSSGRSLSRGEIGRAHV